jgi:multidrug efflux pump subunit AcrA (membrane-fusion protein)
MNKQNLLQECSRSHIKEGTMIQETRKWIVIGTLISCIALVISACSILRQSKAVKPTSVPVVTQDSLVSAEGHLIPQHVSRLSFPVSGKLGEVLVKVGDEVSKGYLLAQMGNQEALEATLSQAKIELLSAQQGRDLLNDTEDLTREQSALALVEARSTLNEVTNSLAKLNNDQFQEELEDLNISVDNTKADLDDAKNELDKHLDLDPENATRKKAQTAYDNALSKYNDAVYKRDQKQFLLDKARATVELAVARLDDAQRQYDQVKDGVDPDALDLAEARLELAKTQVVAAQISLENADLTAPFDGTIIDVIDLQPGELVPAGTTIVVVADLTAWKIETTDLTELDVVNVSPGQQVLAIPDALPDLELRGVVESIDQVFSQKSGDILYIVHILLDDINPRLRWGMTVEVHIDPYP